MLPGSGALRLLCLAGCAFGGAAAVRRSRLSRLQPGDQQLGCACAPAAPRPRCSSAELARRLRASDARHAHNLRTPVSGAVQGCGGSSLTSASTEELAALQPSAAAIASRADTC